MKYTYAVFAGEGSQGSKVSEHTDFRTAKKIADKERSERASRWAVVKVLCPDGVWTQADDEGNPVQ